MGTSNERIEPPSTTKYSNYRSSNFDNLKQDFDYENFKEDPKLTKWLNLDEKIVFSAKILKCN